MSRYLKQETKFSCLFLLACGSVVEKEEALRSLKLGTQQYGFFIPLYDMLTCLVGWGFRTPLLLVPIASSAILFRFG
jgi:hypothetical protein